MKILIIGGFLGSGKTTALLDIARYIVEHSGSKNANKVAIIENEVGEVGIDDKMLTGGGIDVRNLFAGCVCCTLVGGLIDSVTEIEKEVNPDYLILETTGVAYPSSIRETVVDMMGFESRTLTLVDCSRWARIRVPLAVLIEGQIRGADVVVLNKCDLVEQDVIEAIQKEALELEPSAKVFKASIDAPLDEQQILAILGTDES